MTTAGAFQLDVPFGTLHGLRRGTPGARRVLALHGWLDNAASFDAVAPRLAGLRLICLDLPGHGRSEHLGPGQLYAFVDWVAWVHGVVEALGWERFGLLGHSLGAAIASMVAGTFPARVSRLALLEGLGPLSDDPEDGPSRLARSIEEQRRRQPPRMPVYADLEQAATRLQAAVRSLSLPAARVLVSRGLRAVEGGVTWRSDPRLRVASRLRLSEAQVLAFLRAIEAPTLLVRGTEGSPFAPEPMSARVAAVRDATVVELPGGHHLHLDHAEPVADALATFFAPLLGDS